MKRKLATILAVAMAAAISMNVTGCGSAAQSGNSTQGENTAQSENKNSEQSGSTETSQVDTMTLTLTDGTVEEFKGKELYDLAYSNNAAANKYRDAAVEMTAKVYKVTSFSDTTGKIEFTNKAVVNYKSKWVDFVSTLKQGDNLKVTGYIVNFGDANFTPTISTTYVPKSINETTVDDDAFKMEKVES